MMRLLRVCVCTLALVAFGGSEALARVGMVTRELSTPLARFFLTETAEGAELASRLLGRPFRYSEEEIQLLMRRLLTDEELRPVARELASRLDRSERLLRVMLRTGAIPGEATGELSRLVVLREMRLELAEAGEIRFLAPGPSPTVRTRDSFLEGLEAPAAAPVPAPAAAPAAAAPAPARGAVPVATRPRPRSAGGASPAPGAPADPARAAAEAAARAANGIGPFSTLTGPVLKPGMVMDGADLRFVDFRGLEGVMTQMEQVNLSWAMLDEAQLRGVNMLGATAERASFRGANFEDGTLRHLSAVGADFRGARLSNADLRGADLRGADLSTARLGGIGFGPTVNVKLRGAIYDDATRLPFSRETADSLGMIYMN